jgi:hypothetical protein
MHQGGKIWNRDIYSIRIWVHFEYDDILWQGNRTKGGGGNLGHESKVVLTINEEILGKSYTIYSGNFYSSPELALSLKNRQRLTSVEQYRKTGHIQ